MTSNGRTRAVLAACIVGVVAMTGLAYAAVPLYRAFCQATGFNGAGRRGEAGSAGAASSQTVSVRFDTNVKGLPWTFAAEQETQTVHLGAPSQAFFRVTNTGATGCDRPGRLQHRAGGRRRVLHQDAVLLLNDQTIPAGKTVEFPVIYFVEPKYARDSSTRDIPEIVLSYTFYPAPDAKKAA